VKIPLSPFEPDKASYNVAAVNMVVNALPIADGWGPMPSLSEVIPVEAEPEAIQTITGCTGVFHARTATGTVATFAGTATALYQFNPTDLVWEEVTRASGSYSSSFRWVFIQFGNRVLATNGTDQIQKFDLGSDAEFENLAGSPPVCRSLIVVGDFVVALGIDGAPDTVRWCAINDTEQWTIGEAGADEQRMPVGGDIMNGVPVTGGAVILMRSAMRAMRFALETGFIFAFSDITTERGAASPYGVAQIGQDDYVFYSPSGFYRTNSPIGAERVDSWFNDTVDADYLEDMEATVDPFRKVVWWRFRAKDGSNNLLGYNWMLDRWCYSDIQFQALARVATPAVTIDGMDKYFDTIDDIDVPFDSRFWQSGASVFGGVSLDGRLAFLTGANLATDLYTAQFSPSDPDRFFVNGARLDSDGATYTMTLGSADYKGQEITWRQPVTPSSRTRFCSIRGDGRMHKLRVSYPAGAQWRTATTIELMGERSGFA
jgi:hypothetical protein